MFDHTLSDADRRTVEKYLADKYATSYYFDSNAVTGGNGSLTSPWKSISSANGHTFNPGDRLLFKRGSTWRETLNINPASGSGITAAGTAQAPVYLGSYPTTGNQPIISGGTTITSWTEVGASGVYYTSVSGVSSCYFLTEDSVPISFASSSTCTDGNWYFDTTNLNIYYKPTSGTPSNHVADRVTRIGISVNKGSGGYLDGHLRIDDLHLTCGRAGVYISLPMSGSNATIGFSDIIMDHCALDYNKVGIQSNAGFGSGFTDTGLKNSGIDITNNTFTRNSQTILLQSYTSMSNERHVKCRVEDNVILSGGIFAKAASGTWQEWNDIVLAMPGLSSPMRTDEEGIGLQNLDSCVVDGNILEDNSTAGSPGGCHGAGISVWAYSGSDSLQNSKIVNCSFTNNQITGLEGPGIGIGGGITVGGTWGPSGSGNLIADNTISNCGKRWASESYWSGGLHLSGLQSPDPTILTGNILTDNDVNILINDRAQNYIIGTSRSGNRSTLTLFTDHYHAMWKTTADNANTLDFTTYVGGSQWGDIFARNYNSGSSSASGPYSTPCTWYTWTHDVPASSGDHPDQHSTLNGQPPPQ